MEQSFNLKKSLPFFGKAAVLAALSLLLCVGMPCGTVHAQSTCVEDASAPRMTYIFHNVDGTVLSTQIVKNNGTLLQPAYSTGEHTVFDGWYTAATGGSQFTSFGTQTVTANSTVHLYAHTHNAYYVFFHDQYGRIRKTKKADNGATVDATDVTFITDPTSGISGWYTASDYSGTAVNSVTISNADVHLYAKVENGYWLTFHEQGGSYTKPVFYKPSTTTSAPTTPPTRQGYTFAGWYTAAMGGTEFSFGNELNANTELYAHWTAQSVNYLVIHWQENADDDDYSYTESQTQTGTTGSATNATRKSYTGFTAETITQQTIAGDGSTIVNVYYKRNTYTLKFYRESGWWREDESIRITAKHGAYIGTRWPESVTGRSKAWYVNESTSTAQVFLEIMPMEDKSYYAKQSCSGSSSTCYAYYRVMPIGGTNTSQASSYTVLHHTDYDCGSGYKVTAEDRYPLRGFTVKTSLSPSNGDRYCGKSFYYTRNRYSLTYYNGNVIAGSVQYEYEASLSGAGSYVPPRPAGMDANYEFQGWYKDPAGTQSIDFSSMTMPAGNLIVYAKWTAPQRKVTAYITIEGSGSPTVYDVDYGDKIDESAMPGITCPANTEWYGWVVRKGTPPNYEYDLFSFNERIFENVTLYPYCLSNAQYTMRYDVNGGTGTVTDATQYMAGGGAPVLAFTATAPAGKQFICWNTASDRSGTDIYAGDLFYIHDSDADNKLYAVYGGSSANVTLTYDGNGATPPAAVTLPANGTAVLPTLTWAGYDFLGWSTSSTATAAEYAAGTTLAVTCDVTLYAVWKRQIVIHDRTAVICTGETATIDMTPAADELIPAGVTYTWARPVVSPDNGTVSGAGLAPSPTGGAATMAFALSNSGTAPATATYTVTPHLGDGTGSTFTVTVTVNPATTPAFASLETNYCYNATGTVTLPANSSVQTYVSGSTTQQTLTGTWVPSSFNLNNNTTENLTVNATFTPTAGQCAVTLNKSFTIYPQVNAGTIAADVTSCYYIDDEGNRHDINIPQLLSTQDATGGAPGGTYSWTMTTGTGGTPTTIPEANNNTYTPGTLADGSYYFARVYNNACGNQSSNAINVISAGEIIPGSICTTAGDCDLVICSNGALGGTLTANPSVSEHVGNAYSIVWQYRVSDDNGSNWGAWTDMTSDYGTPSGTNNKTLTLPSTMSNTGCVDKLVQYRYNFTYTNCDKVLPSNDHVMLTVHPNPQFTVTVPTGDDQLCSHLEEYIVSAKATCTGAAYNYTWTGATASTADVAQASIANANRANCGTEYTVTVTAQTTDGCETAQTASFTTKDQTVPTFTVPADVTLAMNANCTYDADPEKTGKVTVTDDACKWGDITAAYTDTPTEIWNPCPTVSIARSWTVTDGCGNTSAARVQTITFTDQTAPALAAGKTFPADVNNINACSFEAAKTAGLITVPATGTIKALYEDGCSRNNLTCTSTTREAAGNTTCNWTVYVDYSIKDACGNETVATRTYKGGDKTAPVLISGQTFPADQANMTACFNALPDGPAANDIKALYEDCSGVSVDRIQNASGSSCSWTEKFTYTIKDGCNNSTTKVLTYTGTMGDGITFTDGTNAKTVTCPAEANVQPHTLTPSVMPTVKDACGTTLNYTGVTNSDAVACEGTRTYTYTYTDCAGHTADWTFTYTVDRTTAVPTVETDVTKNVECIGDATAPSAVPTATSSCGETLNGTLKSTVDNPSPLTCNGTRTYTYEYKDCAGNTAEWHYVYNIGHDKKPSIAASITSKKANVAACVFTVPDVITDNVTASAYCSDGSIVELSQSPAAGDVITATASVTVTAKDNCGRTNTIEVQVTVPDNFTAVISSTQKETCAGNNGTATVTVTGGTTPFSYVWNTTPEQATIGTTSTTNTATGLAHGINYTVTVTDADGCSKTATTQVELNNDLVISNYTREKPVCHGGSFDIVPTATGGTGTVTYTWAVPASTSTQVSGNAGTDQSSIHDENLTNTTGVSQTLTYTVTATSGVCTSTGFAVPIAVAITVNPAISITAPDYGPLCSNIGNVNITPTFSGMVNNYNTKWTFNGATFTHNNVAAGTNDALTVTIPATPVKATYHYTVEVTDDADGCSGSQVGGDITIEVPAWTVAADSTLGVQCVSEAVEKTMATVKDGCGRTLTPAVALTKNTVTSDCEGTVEYTYTYNDQAGTAASVKTRKLIYTVVHNDNPVVQSDGYATAKTVNCIDDVTAPEATAVPKAKDVCGNVLEATLKSTVDNPSPLTCNGTRTYTYEYKDCAGKTATWAYTVTLNENSTPVIEDFTIENTKANVTACVYTVPDYTAQVRAKSSDACTAREDLTVTQSPAAGTTITGNTEVTITVTDKCGHSATKTVNVTIPERVQLAVNSYGSRCYGVDDGFINLTVKKGTPGYTLTYTSAAASGSLPLTHNPTTVSIENLPDGAYTLTVKDADGCEVTTSSPVTIEQISETLTVTANSNSKVYDGTVLADGGYTVTFGTETYSVSAGNSATLANGDIVTATVSGTQTVRGSSDNTVASYTVTRSGADITCYYNTVPTKGTLEVTPRAITLTAGSVTKEYDGYEHSWSEAVPTYTISAGTLASGESISDITITGSRTLVGTTPTDITPNSVVIMKGTENMTANYDITLLPGNVTITERTEKYPITVTANSKTVTYDGTEQSVSGFQTLTFVVNGKIYKVEGLTATATGTDVNSYTSFVTGTAIVRDENNNNVTSQFNVQTTNGILTINKKDLAIRVVDEKMYDKERLENLYTQTGKVTATGLVAGDVLTAGKVSTTGAQVGTYTYAAGTSVITEAFATQKGISNYNVTYDFLQTINANTNAIVIASGSNSWKYDGAAHSEETYTVTYNGTAVAADATGKVFTLPTGDKVFVSAPASITHVSENAANNNTYNYVLENASNYTSVTANYGAIAVTCRSVDITSRDSSKVYDGTALTNHKVNVTGDGFIGGEGATYSYTGTITDVGQTANTFSYTLNAGTQATDYCITPIMGELKVTPVTDEVVVTIKGHKGEFCYDSHSHTVHGYDVTITDALGIYTKSDFSFSGDSIITKTLVGDYYMNLQPGQFTNLNPNFGNVKFVVTDGRMIIWNTLTITNVSVTDVTCNGANDGKATITVTGGKEDVNPRYSFTLDAMPAVGSNSPYEISALVPGTHTIAVSDALGCSASQNFTVSQPEVLTATLTTPADLCPNRSSYAVSVTAAGGNGGYHYVWSNDATAIDASATTVNKQGTNDCGHTYNVTVKVTDSKGCTVTENATFKVEDNEAPDFTVSADKRICYTESRLPEHTGEPTNLTDNCTAASGLTVTYTDVATHSATSVSTIARTWKVADLCGNVTNKVQTIYVMPEVVMDAITDQTICTGESSTAVHFSSIITDGTMTYAWTNSDTRIGLAASGNGDIAPFTAANPTLADLTATVTVIPTYTNGSTVCIGNSRSFSIKVRPSIITPGAFDLTCPPDITLTLDYGECGRHIDIGTPVIENHMSGMTVVITNDAPADGIFSEGTTTVTWKATDECGASLTCTQQITVNYPPCGTPADSVADANGYKYSSVRIGCNCWTGENLRTTTYMDPTTCTAGAPVAEYRSYMDSDSLEAIYGKLYTWYSAVNVPEGNNSATPATQTTPSGATYVQGICPCGWAMPIPEEYLDMLMHSGGTVHAKEADSRYWLPGTEGQAPLSGFDARGAGYWDASTQRYLNLMGQTNFWTATSGENATAAKSVEINYYCEDGIVKDLNKGLGLSIRCIRKK